MIYEICVGNYIEAIDGLKRGAHRIELCDNLKEDGTTPSYGTIKKVVEDVEIPVMVIIRPRGGNFTYSKEEIEIMKMDIDMVKKAGAHGIVIGAIKDGDIDYDCIEDLMDIRGDLEVTFHMAFDELSDLEHMKNAIDRLFLLGINRILTKGGKGDALYNWNSLKKLVEYAENRIIIMPGKGVNKSNRDYILEKTGATEIHGTKVV
ncbi:copper homeostasis protein CutC [uncultured Clostridium sp.]|uniref:copper homeostasis protein CutC n=1 Tax=uncultured Clostridium sp. TaxID=59620 RepID=UPI002632B18A|nr:copper homeostasis protein CutC [uncultured Clostridium sp.]